MKRLLIISDSHGNKDGIIRAFEAVGDIDAVVHLGDLDRDIACLRGRTRVYSVRGNCDIGSVNKEERLVSFGGRRILMLHGHKQRVKQGLLNLGFYAQEKNADAVLFGHTHIPKEVFGGEALLYNPGALSGMRPSYGILEIDDSGKISVKTHLLLP